MHVSRIAEAPEGIIRVTTDGDWTDKATRKACRDLAAGEAHTLVGAPMNVTTRKGKTTADYAPLQRKGKATAPAPVAADDAAPMSDGDRLAYLERMIERQAAEIMRLRGEAPDGEAPDGDTFRERVIVPRAKARASVSCKSCKDYGVVRGVGEHKGQPYKTRNGAEASAKDRRAAKCPACKGKGTGAIRLAS